MLDHIIKKLERGISFTCKVSPDLDITIYPAEKEGDPDTVAYTYIGGTSLGISFKDNESAAHFLLGFQGIKEVVNI